MTLFGWRMCAVLLLIAAFTSFGNTTAFAHEGRDVGDYNFVVGFVHEPAIEGIMNGVSIRVTSLVKDGHDDHDHGDHSHAGATDMESNGEIDLVSHGGVFVHELAEGENYDFTFTHDFEELTVPFHAHPIEIQGSIMVGHDNPSVDVTVIEIHESGFRPDMAMIQTGTTVRFANMMSEATVIMSGPLGISESMKGSNVHSASDAVSGIKTLQVEVTHVASSVSKIMDLKETMGDPGHYKSEFIPTSPGSYNFRFFGEIDGQKVDASFESSNTTFDEVISANDFQFPVQLAASRETENAARGALAAANEASANAADATSSASTSRVLGLIALVLGVFGLIFGGLAFQRSGKKRESVGSNKWH